MAWHVTLCCSLPRWDYPVAKKAQSHRQPFSNTHGNTVCFSAFSVDATDPVLSAACSADFAPVCELSRRNQWVASAQRETHFTQVHTVEKIRENSAWGEILIQNCKACFVYCVYTEFLVKELELCKYTVWLCHVVILKAHADSLLLCWYIMFGYISVVLTAIGSGDSQGKVRNAGSWVFGWWGGGRGGQRISDYQRAVMNGSGITGHRQLGWRWSSPTHCGSQPLWRDLSSAPPDPHLFLAPVGKSKGASPTQKRVFICTDPRRHDNLPTILYRLFHIGLITQLGNTFKTPCVWAHCEPRRALRMIWLFLSQSKRQKNSWKRFNIWRPQNKPQPVALRVFGEQMWNFLLI